MCGAYENSCSLASSRSDESEFQRAGEMPDRALNRGKRANRGAIPDAENRHAAPHTGKPQAGENHSHFASKSPHANTKIKLLTLVTASLITLPEATICPIFPERIADGVGKLTKCPAPRCQFGLPAPEAKKATLPNRQMGDSLPHPSAAS